MHLNQVEEGRKVSWGTPQCSHDNQNQDQLSPHGHLYIPPVNKTSYPKQLNTWIKLPYQLAWDDVLGLMLGYLVIGGKDNTIRQEREPHRGVPNLAKLAVGQDEEGLV